MKINVTKKEKREEIRVSERLRGVVETNQQNTRRQSNELSVDANAAFKRPTTTTTVCVRIRRRRESHR